MDLSIFDGHKLKNKRLEKGFTQNELAVKCGIADDRVIRKYETSGVCKNEVFLRLCRELDTPEKELQLVLPCRNNAINFLNQHHLSELFRFIIYSNHLNKSSKINLTTVGEEFKLFYEGYSGADLRNRILEDFWIMKYNGWIDFANINPYTSKELETDITFRNPITKTDDHFMYILCEIASGMKNNETKWDLRKKSRNRNFLYKEDRGDLRIMDLVEDLFILKSRFLISYRRANFCKNPICNISILQSPFKEK